MTFEEAVVAAIDFPRGADRNRILCAIAQEARGGKHKGAGVGPSPAGVFVLRAGCGSERR